MANEFKHATAGTALTQAEFEATDRHTADSQAQGDILYCDGTYWKRLGAGTSGQFLKTQGAGANPVWDDATFIPLSIPLTSTSWDGDSFSTTAATLIDLSAVFSVPAGVRAISVSVAFRDSASAANEVAINLGPAAAVGALEIRASGIANDFWTAGSGIVPCDANGDIYYTITASGASTAEVTMRIWGYWL